MGSSGIEVAEWSAIDGVVTGRIETDWDFPVRVAVAIPEGEGFRIVETTLEPGETTFRLS